jgi:Phosphate-selective porin O and P
MFPRILVTGLCALIALIAGASDASGQILIEAGDEVNFKLGLLGQFQAESIDGPGTDAQTNNLFVRRLRLMFGGQLTKKVTFFVETDTPNLGKTLAAGKSIQEATLIQDAYAEFKVTDAFAVDAGLMFIPFSRNYLQSAASLLPVDYGAYTYAQSGPTQSSTGRDTGFQVKGYVLNDHLEYRIGAFQGLRDTASHRTFRYAGRVQYNMLDPEVGFFYTGSYLGKKKVVSVGGAFDVQSDYHGYALDAFVDHPLGSGAITGQFDYNWFDGGTSLRTLPKQHDILLELGYLVPAMKLTPFVQVAHRNVVDTGASDELRVSVGASYWLAGHNANIKAAYGRIAPSGVAGQNAFTIQLQAFYF